jgi:hypothetical protein
MPETATRTQPAAETTCPTCGAPAEDGQLICLECGSRIALAYRRPPSWRVPVAIVSVVVLAAAAGLYFGIDALTDDAEREVAARPAPPAPQAPASGSGDRDGGKATTGEDEQAGDEKAGKGDARGQKAAKEETPAKERATEKETGSTDGQATAPSVGAGGVRSWPENEDGFTVVILSSEDRRSARAFAQNAIKAGTPAGVLRADDYPALKASTGFFIVFVGSYSNQAKADKAAARLGRRFQGAYPQFVDGSKAKN